MCNKFLVFVTILISLSLSQLHAAEIENLARKAKVWASSYGNRNYLVSYAVDGTIPRLECKDDERQAWCVKGADGMYGEFALSWEKPVRFIVCGQSTRTVRV